MTAARSAAIPEAVDAPAVEAELEEDDPGAAIAGTPMIAAPVVGSDAAIPTIVDQAGDTAAATTDMASGTHEIAGRGSPVVGMIAGIAAAVLVTAPDRTVPVGVMDRAVPVGVTVGRTAGGTARDAPSGEVTTTDDPSGGMIAIAPTDAKAVGSGTTVGVIPREAMTAVAASAGTTTEAGDGTVVSGETVAVTIAPATDAGTPGSGTIVPATTGVRMTGENRAVTGPGAAAAAMTTDVAMTAGGAGGRIAPAMIDPVRAAGTVVAATATIVHRMTGRRGVPKANATRSFPTAWTCGNCLGE